MILLVDGQIRQLVNQAGDVLFVLVCRLKSVQGRFPLKRRGIERLEYHPPIPFDDIIKDFLGVGHLLLVLNPHPVGETR